MRDPRIPPNGTQGKLWRWLRGFLDWILDTSKAVCRLTVYI